MKELLDKIKFTLTRFAFAELDARWNTENFHLPQPGIPFVRLYYPLEGKAYVTLNREEHVLEPGKIYLIAPYAPVRVACPRRLVKYWGHFNAFILDSQLDIFTFAAPVMITQDEFPEFTAKLFKILCRVNSQCHDKHNSVLNEMEGVSALTLLLAPFLKELQNAAFVSKKALRFISLLAYIEEHLAEGITLQRLAKFSGLNPTYLSNSFVAEMGVPLMKYCKQRSVQRALTLMWGGKYTFAEVACLVGAENVTAFSRLFRKYTGFSPCALRKLTPGKML